VSSGLDLGPARADAARRASLGTAAAATLVFFTSASVLVIEILAGRLLAPFLGVSLETYTGIIGTVLAGMALGGALGGRLADRRDPRSLVGPALVTGGGLALMSLPVVSLLGPPLAGGGPFEIVVLAALAFFPSAAVLSAVSPMVAKLRLGNLADTGSVVGGLSAAGTAGALVGTFATGFVLIAALPSRPIVVALGLALVVVGMALSWSMGPRRVVPVAVAVTVLAGLVVLALPGRCQYETAYYCVRVEADPRHPSGRTLVLDNLRHSYVDLDDPAHLEFRYARLLARAIDTGTGAGPLRVLYLGGGGFTLPRWVEATRPGSEARVLEIDPDLVGIARDRLGLRTGPGLEVRVGDARLSLDDEPTAAYDVVIGDAFGGLSVPWHLTTVEVVRQVRRVLRPGGIYGVNVIDGGPRRFLHAEVASLAAVFEHDTLIDPPARDGGAVANHVVVAGDAAPGLTPASVAAEDGSVVPPEELAVRLRGAPLLTDDHAPVDQLLTRR
jgi:MFS family permease